MCSILRHQGNADKILFEISKINKTHPLLVEIQTCKTTMEIGVVVLKEDGNQLPQDGVVTLLGM